MHKTVTSSYQELCSIHFKNWQWVKCDMEFVVDSFLMVVKHKFFLDRLGPVSSLWLLLFSNSIFPHSYRRSHDQTSHTHFSSTILSDSFIFLVYQVVLGLVYGTLLFSFGKPVVLVRSKWRPFKAFHTEIFYFVQLFVGRFINVSQNKT